MKFLSAPTKPVCALFLATVLFVLSGCEEKSPTGIIFSHQSPNHVQVPCATCHLQESRYEPTRPSERVCALCHQIGDHAKPTQTCAKCHTRIDFSAAGLPRPSYRDSKFLHEPHLKADLACVACHRDQNNAKTYHDVHFPTMQECVQCHQQRQAAHECSTCHLYWRDNIMPDSHGDQWLLQHGLFAKEQFETNCQNCHEEKTYCQDCHMNEPPPSHTIFFRNRGHGFMAKGDRNSCKACHQPEACLECHNPETGVRPASHVAGFAEKPYLHCAQCHFPKGEANGCDACHSAGRISEKHREAAERILGPSSFDIVEGFLQVSPNCLNACHPYERKRPPHPLGALSNADCLRCHVN